MNELILIVDEASLLLEDARDYNTKVQRLRHCRCHLIQAIQNASSAPLEFLGNVDCIVAFGMQDKRDRQVVAQSCNLSAEQTEYCSTLETGECICFLPRSRWKQAFLARVPQVEYSEISDEEIRRRSCEAAKTWGWVPLEQHESASMQSPPARQQQTEFFMQDVLNQAHEFSPLMKRFERAGVRSAEQQGRILRDLAGQGLIKIWTLALGRGRPIKLIGPTEKALAKYGVTWRVTRGNLPTRAATAFVGRKLERDKRWSWQAEGGLAGKAVDWLGTNNAGVRWSLEIAGNAGHEVANCLHCLRNGVEKHSVICLDAEILKAVKRAFDCHEEIRTAEKVGRLEVKTLAKVLDRSESLFGDDEERELSGE